MGQLHLENMEFYAHHGHFAEEQIIGGKFVVDILIETDFTQAAETDELSDAVDYTLIYDAIQTEMKVNARLLEHLAKRIVDAVYLVSEKISKVTVKVSKLNPAIGGNMDRFSVILTR